MTEREVDSMAFGILMIFGLLVWGAVVWSQRRRKPLQKWYDVPKPKKPWPKQ